MDLTFLDIGLICTHYDRYFVLFLFTNCCYDLLFAGPILSRNCSKMFVPLVAGVSISNTTKSLLIDDATSMSEPSFRHLWGDTCTCLNEYTNWVIIITKTMSVSSEICFD